MLITRYELNRRKRIQTYKKIIAFGVLVMTFLPILTSVFLMHRIGKLEEKLEVATSANGGDLYTLLSSKEALASNPNVDISFLNGEDSSEELLPTNAEADIKDVDEQNLDADAEETDSIDEEANKNESIQKKVYLTFDDGPSIYTGQILDILAANDIKATFFVIGREDKNYWQYYKRIVDEGHTIGLHTYTHKYNEVYQSVDSFAAEIEQLNDLLYSVTGVTSNIFRFPGGSSCSLMSLPVKSYIEYLNENQMVYYDWNALNGDAVGNDLTAEKMVKNVMYNVSQQDTSIVLMHDLQTRHTTVESLQLLIDTLKSEGYEILAIDENTPLVQHASYDSVE